MRFKWEHRARVHRLLVRAFNRVMRVIPMTLKYELSLPYIRRRPPYALLTKSSSFIQVGAPADTLHAGRSRGMRMALIARQGTGVIIEPDAGSLEDFRRWAGEFSLTGVRPIARAAWSESGVVQLRVDSEHQARNFIEG